MSRRTRERRLDATERWPNLQRLLQGFCDSSSPSVELVFNQAIDGWSLESQQAAAREWWTWNATHGWKSDAPDFLSDGFDVDMDFADDVAARQFMNGIYDRLIVSVRAKAGKDWRPDGATGSADN
jgi:hypothetical protein